MAEVVSVTSERRTLSPEARGYLFWGPVALTVLVTELLGVGWVQKRIDWESPWPTISTTVGHLQVRWNVIAAVVVGVIAAIAFTAVAYRDPAVQTENGRRMPTPNGSPTKVPFYSWQLIFPALALGWIVATTTENKLVVGYVIYGSLALLAVIFPSLLVRFVDREVNFPTLYFTFAKLRQRYAWITATFVALLAVLVFHLALYPWPSITNEPSSYAGLSAGAASSKAKGEIRRLGANEQLVYSTQARGVVNQKDAWLVFFSPTAGADTEHAGCIVTVTKETLKATPECSP